MKYALKPLTACMAAIFGASSFNVLGAPPAAPPAQTQNQNTIESQQSSGIPTATVPLVPAPRPSASRLPAQTTEYPGIPWGTFLVFPEVTLSATYDDNIYAEPTGVSEDVITTLSPSVALKSNWNRHALNVDAGADLDRYRNNDAEDVNDYWLGFDGRYDVSNQTNVFGGARYSRDHEDRSTPGSLNSSAQVEPTLFDHAEAHLGVAHEAGAFRLRAGGTFDQYDYKNGVSGTGAAVDNDYRDHDLGSLGARLGYVLSPLYEFFGQVATDTRHYDQLIPGQTFNRDSDGYRAAAGVKFTLRPQNLAGEAFAGVMRQNFDYSGFADISKPYFGALAVWKPNAQLTATGFIDRALEETVVNDGVSFASSSLDTTVGVEVERKLSSKLSVNARAAYTRSTYQNVDRRDAVIDVGAGLRYYVMPTVFVGADLRIVDRDSDVLNAQYSRNQILLSVGYTPARNRDYSIIPEREAGAPEAPRAQGLLSGFYLGGLLGHGALTTATVGPRSGGGSDIADMGGFGASYALFGGWGTEIDHWYLGVEAEGGDSQANWYHKKDKPDSVTTFVDQNASLSLSARAGYQFDGGLLYGKLGVVSTRFDTFYGENQFITSAFDKRHSETGTRVGFGLDIPASRNLFIRTDYSVTRYNGYDVPYQSSAGGAITTEQFDSDNAVFSVGLGWRFGNDRPAPAARSASTLNGLYAGAHLGHGTLGTELTGTHDIGDTPGDFPFTGDFANTGFTGGVFAGYGLTFNQIYVGLELEAEAANLGWYHDRDTSGSGGRDFSVEKRGSHGASLRVGYVLDNGALLYARIGEVQTRFNTQYHRGSNTNNWVDRSDTLSGTRVGIGAEIPVSSSVFVRMDYSYTHYDNAVSFVTAHATPDAMKFDNSESLVRLGIGFRF